MSRSAVRVRSSALSNRLDKTNTHNIEAEELTTATDEKARCWEAIGRIHEKLGVLEEASEAYKQARKWEENREYPLVHHLSGLAYFEAEDYERALYEFVEAVRLAPERANYHFRLGLTYDRLGRWQLAVRSYKRALNAEKNESTAGIYYYYLGQAYSSMGRPDNALAALKQAVDTNPSELRYLLALAKVYVDASPPNIEKAWESYQRATRHNSDDYLSYQVRGDLLFQQGYYADAAEAYDAAYARSSYKELSLRTAMVAAYEKAVERESERPQLHFGLGRAYERVDDYARATAAYRTATELAQDNLAYQTHLHATLGNVYRENQDWSLAIQEWQQVLEIAPEDTLDLALIYMNLGLAHEEQGATNEALLHYEQAIHIRANERADDFEMRYQIGAAHFRHNRIQYFLPLTEGVVNIIEELLRANSQQLIRQESQFKEDLEERIRYVRGDLGETVTLLSQRSRSMPPQVQQILQLNERLILVRAIVSYNIGNCYYHLRYLDLAQEKWQEAIKHYPQLLEAYQNLGIASFEQGNKGRAQMYWQKALRINPQFEPGRQNLEALEQEKAPNLTLSSIQ